MSKIEIYCKYDELIDPTIKDKIKPQKLKSLDTILIKINNDSILINRKYLPLFAAFSWYVIDGGGQTKYLRANVIFNKRKRTMSFHQMIMGNHDDLEVDHINGNGLDNRIENLRLVTHQQNQLNQRKRLKTSSKYYGVSWCKRDKKWQVHCNWKNNPKNIGRFENEKEAAVAYNNYLIKNNIPKVLNNV